MGFQQITEYVVLAVGALGVAVIVLGALLGIVIAGWRLMQRQADVYRHFRRFLGRSILLGLELLVAADIIRTVAVTLSLQSVALLAIIVCYSNISELVVRARDQWSLALAKTRPSELSSPESIEP